MTMTARPALAAALAALIAAPATAASCWSPAAVEAAQVRELHVMLMTVKLRCRNVHPDIVASYEQFEVNHKKTIFSAEDRLRAHYGTAKSEVGKADFARFHTNIANFYGVGRSDASNCAMFDLVTRELAKPESGAKTMAEIAGHMIPDPRIDGPRCPTETAAKP